jgi:hypothetical protein
MRAIRLRREGAKGGVRLSAYQIVAHGAAAADAHNAPGNRTTTDPLEAYAKLELLFQSDDKL